MSPRRPYPGADEDYDPAEPRIWDDVRAVRQNEQADIVDPVDPDEPSEADRARMLAEFRDRLGRAR